MHRPYSDPSSINEMVKLCANWRSVKAEQMIGEGIISKFSYDIIMVLFL